MSSQIPSPRDDQDHDDDHDHDHDLPKYLQDHQISPELRDLVLSMPRHKGWVATSLHQHQGFWHTTRQLLGVLSCQNHFIANDTDIILVTAPKSGTTWLKALVFSLLNRSHYPFPFTDPQKRHPLLTTNPHVLVPFLELDHYVDNRLPDLSLAPSPRLFSTHLPHVSLPESITASRCKLVYLCRNPKDAFVSLWHFTNRLRPKEWGQNSLAESLDMFCRGVSLCGPFWEHCLGYWKASLEQPEKVLFLRYEDLKRDFEGFHVRRLAEFVGCPFSEQEEANGVVEEILGLCSFQSLSGLDVNKSGKLPTGEATKAFFRRGEVGDWVNYLTADMAAKLDAVVEAKLCGSGLKF